MYSWCSTMNMDNDINLLPKIHNGLAPKRAWTDLSIKRPKYHKERIGSFGDLKWKCKDTRQYESFDDPTSE